MKESFLVCIYAVIPTFLIMAVGYFCKTIGMLDRDSVGKFNKVMFKAFMPVMLFNSIYNSDLNQAFSVKLMLFVVIGFFIEVVISIFLSRFFTTERNRRGVIAQGMFRANTVVVGLPIAMQLLGDVDLGPVIVSIAIAAPIFNIAAVVVLEMFSGESTSFKKLMKGIVTNPLIVSTVVAVLFVLLKIKLPKPIMSTVNSMGQAASPVLLFLVGAFFSFDRIGESKKELIISTAFRLLIFPAMYLFLAMAMGFRDVDFVAVMTIFASSTAVSSFTMSQQLGGDADLAGNIVVLTSLLCPLTFFLWSFLFKILGVF